MRACNAAGTRSFYCILFGLLGYKIQLNSFLFFFLINIFKLVLRGEANLQYFNIALGDVICSELLHVIFPCYGNIFICFVVAVDAVQKCSGFT